MWKMACDATDGSSCTRITVRIDQRHIAQFGSRYDICEDQRRVGLEGPTVLAAGGTMAASALMIAWTMLLADGRDP